MLGNFQQTHLRIEVEAPAQKIRESLIHTSELKSWLRLQRFADGIPDSLQLGTTFTTWLGTVVVHHQVQLLESNSLRLILSQGIDGFHQWYWGDGWVQSSVEGISLLPLNFGQTVSLLQLRHHLTSTN